jgi:hypothetical protein
MKLYHFTASRFIPAIRRQGLKIGGIADFSLTPKGNIALHRLIDGYIWLTDDPNFNQDWENNNRAQRYLVKYSRTDWRFTVVIPNEYEINLRRWQEFEANGEISALTYQLLNESGGGENWWLYKGKIPNFWFTELTANPSKKEYSVVKESAAL